MSAACVSCLTCALQFPNRLHLRASLLAICSADHGAKCHGVFDDVRHRDAFAHDQNEQRRLRMNESMESCTPPEVVAFALETKKLPVARDVCTTWRWMHKRDQVSSDALSDVHW
eukprot:1327024-Amphidinium_carterae.1